MSTALAIFDAKVRQGGDGGAAATDGAPWPHGPRSLSSPTPEQHPTTMGSLVRRGLSLSFAAQVRRSGGAGGDERLRGAPYITAPRRHRARNVGYLAGGALLTLSLWRLFSSQTDAQL